MDDSLLSEKSNICSDSSDCNNQNQYMVTEQKRSHLNNSIDIDDLIYHDGCLTKRWSFLPSRNAKKLILQSFLLTPLLLMGENVIKLSVLCNND